MTTEPRRNLAASIHRRLLNRARERGEELQSRLTRYALERLLYRLAQSPYRDTFLLKGAMLFYAWTGQPHRATRDLDLLGYGENRINRIDAMFREVCREPVEDDGLAFRADTVLASIIKEGQDYEGLRVRFEARLGNARIPIQVDIGFSDAITPGLSEILYPTILSLPAPTLRAYPVQTLVAEKFHAMVALGLANSRMKDFYDVWTLARTQLSDGPVLSRAIRATFERRKTSLPDSPPLALTAAFSQDSGKQTQWRAFMRRARLVDEPVELDVVVTVLSEFLGAPALAVRAEEPFRMRWPVGGPWKAI